MATQEVLVQVPSVVYLTQQIYGMVERVQEEPYRKVVLSIIKDNNMFLLNYKKYTAFTLAEVLITLLIIGIVASLIIPGLIADTQKQEDYTRLLKAVSVIQNAANLVRMENGGRMAGVANTNLDLANLFATKMNYIKFCKDQTDSENCYISNSADMYNLRGKILADVSPYPYSGLPKIVTSDGFVYFFQLQSSSCKDNHYVVNGIPQACGVVFIDINGVKPPNTWGKDIFIIQVNDHNVITNGNSGNTDTSSLTGCSSSNTSIWVGSTCASRAIMENGIKYY